MATPPRWPIRSARSPRRHGYSHVDPGGRDGPELVGRDAGAIGRLIRDGLSELRAAGLAADGFIAPCYLHPREADAACRAEGLGWWATRGSLRSAGGRRALPSIGLGASRPGRRALSPLAAGGAARMLAPWPVTHGVLEPGAAACDVGPRQRGVA